MDRGRIALLLAAAVAGCSRHPPVQAIREWTLRREPEPLVRVEASRVWDVPDLYVARCDYQESWWGFFGCYAIEGGRVVWQASIDEEPSEQSIHSVRGAACDVVGAPLIEVIGVTHMGNGSLYVYELRDRALRTVLRTRAYDGNRHEGLVFRGHTLEVELRGSVEIELSGTLQRLDDDGRLLEQWPCRKAFVWDPVRRRFRQDVARRQGFDRYPESETWPD